jgi:predicted acylesterase/phospholipase RssA
MTGRSSAPDSYSPQRRTALVLTGIGTAGAYHAGVLRALHEAGVKLDVVAGRGIGVIGALFAAVDGAQRLWEERGFWRASAVAGFYPWRPVLRLVAWTLAASVALVAVPLALMAAGLIVFPIDFLLTLVGMPAGSGLAGHYLALAERAVAPSALPTWLPRLVFIALALAAGAALAAGWAGRVRRRDRGPFWWRMVGAPLTARPAVEQCWNAMWVLLRGAAHLNRPSRQELGRRFTERLTDNLDQPGFRELLIAVHDLDARRDVVFALVAESRRPGLVRRRTAGEADARRAEIVDLAGVARDHLADAVAASLAVPLATEPHTMTFAPDAYWRGEAHRLCDRPGSLQRLIEELAPLGVEQIVLVSASPEPPGPHAMAPPRLDGRGRLGEYLYSSEAALIRDLSADRGEKAPRLFTIRPAHNPIGPFDFAGGFDDRSDRRQPLAELMGRGYEDAYVQFIEPVVGASGERVGQPAILPGGRGRARADRGRSL